MPALIQSRRLRVFIGNDQQNWSTSVGEFLPVWDSLSESGLITVSATLEILKVSTNPESIDPRDNPTRWRAGQPVLVEVANSAGAYVVHPMGRLFLLEEPDFPEPGGGIVLELGCRLAWHNTFEYDDEKTGITLGTSMNSASAVRNLLLANEIPDGNISVSSWPYGLTVPQGKGPGGSFVQQAGEIAYSNNYRYLYQNTSGTIVAGALDLAVASPVVTVTLGTNDVAYQSVKTGTPPDQIKVAGTGTVTTEAPQPIVESFYTEGSKVGIAECSGTGIVESGFSKTLWYSDSSFSLGSSNLGFISYSGNLIIYQTFSAFDGVAGAVLSYSDFFASRCGLVRWKQSNSFKVYDLDKGKKLILEATMDLQSPYSFLPPIPNVIVFGGFRATKLARTFYTYDDDDNLTETRYIETVPRIILDKQDNEFNTRQDGVNVEDTTTKWQKQGDNTWRKITINRRSAVLTNTKPNINSSAVVSTSNTTTSSTGENQPPRAELWDGGIITEDVEYQFTVNYTQPGGGSGRTRKQLYTLPYAFSEGQCQTMANLHLKLVAGQHRAVAVEMPVTDALLTAPPLFAFDVVEPSGRRSHYRADSLAWEHSVDTCKAAATGILVGVTPAPTEGNPNPDPEPVTGTGVVAGGIPVEAGGLQVYATI